jgi:PilZ domain-containing protein
VRSDVKGSHRGPEVQVHEKRREERHAANGSVRVQFSNPRIVKIDGRLIDVSSGGFRMSHEYTSLAAGQVVDFTHAGATGRARVMWNRILESAVETGFLVTG